MYTIKTKQHLTNWVRIGNSIFDLFKVDTIEFFDSKNEMHISFSGSSNKHVYLLGESYLLARELILKETGTTVDDQNNFEKEEK